MYLHSLQKLLYSDETCRELFDNKLLSVKKTWAHLYLADAGEMKSFIKPLTEFSIGVIRYMASIEGKGSRFLFKSSTTI